MTWYELRRDNYIEADGILVAIRNGVVEDILAMLLQVWNQCSICFEQITIPSIPLKMVRVIDCDRLPRPHLKEYALVVIIWEVLANCFIYTFIAMLFPTLAMKRRIHFYSFRCGRVSDTVASVPVYRPQICIIIGTFGLFTYRAFPSAPSTQRTTPGRTRQRASD